jgi:hypothetical protein
MGTVPHPGCTWKDMFARGYQFVNAGSDVARLRDGSLADVKEFRALYRQAKANGLPAMPNRIVVCPEPLAAAAGAAIFRAGGSAVDAAVATAMRRRSSRRP